MFPRAFLDEVRERVSIVDYIGKRVELKKAGRNHKGLCPFHAEKSPSFLVSEDKQIFHCFGCSEGGDLIQFVMKFESMPFPEAVELLAGQAGLEVPQQDSKDRSQDSERDRRRKWCFRLNELARDFFAQQLQNQGGSGAREYLKKRGIDPQNFTQHFLGFADKDWESLSEHLRKAGAPLKLAAELGLLRERQGGGFYDFFRNRLVFPILSPRDEVLGFGGRTLDDEESAKYLNSPDSLIYHKSNSVYGLNFAKHAIRKLDQLIVVEGYMDVLALAQAGIEHAVAPLGTALTEGHLRLLHRYSRNLVLVFDGDPAGIAAQVRALPLFLAAGMVPRAALLPSGEDPDTMVQKEGAEKFLQRLQTAPTLFEFFIDHVVKQTGHDSKGQVEAMKQIVPLLRQVDDSVERSVYQKHIAKRLVIDMSVVEQALADKLPQVSSSPSKAASGIVVRSEERTLVETLLANPQMIGTVFCNLQPEDFLDEWCKAVIELLFKEWQTCESKKDVASDDDKQAGFVNIAAYLDKLEDKKFAQQMRAIALAESTVDDLDLKKLVDDCVARIKRRPLNARMGEINQQIRAAELAGDDIKLFELLNKKQDLSKQLKVTKNI